MKEIKIIICAKQVPDPEAPFTAVHVDPEAKKISTEGVPPVINPFDENAIEAALHIKEEAGAEITVLSMGDKISQAVLRSALAVGANNLILLDDPRFKDLDSSATAYVLSTAIKKIGEYDLIFTGRQAGDWDSGQTGLILGEILGIVSINLARGVRVDGDKVIVEKMISDGYELVRAGMPALITISSEVGELRYPALKQRMLAHKQPIEIWRAEDLEIDPGKLNKMEMMELCPPSDMERQCRFVEGSSPEEKGANLAIHLKESQAK